MTMPVFQTSVFLLCILSSATCAALLFRQYSRTRLRLLLWSAICFVALTANNLFVLFDIVVLPDVELLPFRQLSSLTAVSVLLYAFIWETE
jgi:hypothetical protein